MLLHQNFERNGNGDAQHTISCCIWFVTYIHWRWNWMPYIVRSQRFNKTRLYAVPSETSQLNIHSNWFCKLDVKTLRANSFSQLRLMNIWIENKSIKNLWTLSFNLCLRTIAETKSQWVTMLHWHRSVVVASLSYHMLCAKCITLWIIFFFICKPKNERIRAHSGAWGCALYI